jgi:hypothetical protein
MERWHLIASMIDRAVLWLVVLAAVGVLSYLAIRADRDPPALISPACVTTPSKGAPKT